MSTTTGIDAVTQQIVANALASIADEMATTIFRTAHSTVVRDGMDFSAASTVRASRWHEWTSWNSGRAKSRPSELKRPASAGTSTVRQPSSSASPAACTGPEPP